MRYFLRFSYLGKNFHGWQIQPNASSVQEHLNRTLSLVTGEEVYAVGAGRTDTGVHAREMWAHFDLEREFDPGWLGRLNAMLGPDIALMECRRVDAEAHARFDALERSYTYQITRQKDPFLQDTAWYCPRPLEWLAMEKATRHLPGQRDFSSFARSNTQTKTNICKVTEARWTRDGSLWCFHISADRFLRNMVRAVVGTLVEIGTGKRAPEDMLSTIEAKDRSFAGESAPARGLFLTRVRYPQNIWYGE